MTQKPGSTAQPVQLSQYINDAITYSIYPFHDNNSSITVSHNNYWLSCSFGNEVIPHIDKVLLWGLSTLKEKRERLNVC